MEGENSKECWDTRFLQRHVHDDLVAPSAPEPVGADSDDLNHVAAVGQQAGDDGPLGRTVLISQHSNWSKYPATDATSHLGQWGTFSLVHIFCHIWSTSLLGLTRTLLHLIAQFRWPVTSRRALVAPNNYFLWMLEADVGH